ncbi:NB-Dependent Receptor Plug [uncultured Paludibacter sp.]|uniref:NB-Dependent Receptor Plug n=1 Tax=uncultured Paludibacter sp. TaxID=497635 RepID=A0A653AHT1_9BACT|nr:NB-Dependent Receptor Plug [uncultured Paludibacter sp.]
MKNKIKLLLFLFFVGSGILFAQSPLKGTVTDENGEPIVGASVLIKGTSQGTATDAEGKFTLTVPAGSKYLIISYVGMEIQEIPIVSNPRVVLVNKGSQLDEVVVTALGIKKDRKALGYAVEDVKSEELMRNKQVNVINSLSGKIAGVNVTQSSGAAGSGSQIILRGGTSASETRDNQPLFVVDGVIYDNSSSVVGNSAFDGAGSSSSTMSNRVMDINPEDIENISVLKGPAASALYGSRASAGVILITTKKGKEGAVEVNFSTKYISSWAKYLPETQTKYKRGYMEDQYDSGGNYTGTIFNNFSYNSWGEKMSASDLVYDNIGNFYQNGGIYDTNLSVSGGTKNSNFYLSGSYYDQGGIIPTTGYTKSTLRFNGEQRYGIFTFSANAAYSDAATQKTLTSAALYNSQGTGALYAVNTWSPSDDMSHYLNEDGTRYRMFGDLLDPWDERDNPYWIINKNKLYDSTERFTGNFNVKADITKWWWIAYRMGVDSYTTENHTRIAPEGAVKLEWQNGMMSDNTLRFKYLSTNLMTNLNKKLGDFDLNLMLGTSTDNTHTNTHYEMAWNFQVPNFYATDNATSDNRNFKTYLSDKRLVGVFGEFRADWRNAIFFTVTGRNDWTSTLPIENRSYFYPSFNGSVVFTEFLPKMSWLNFGKVRVSGARVGKDTGPYETNTALWPVATYIGGKVGVGNSWTRGNPYIKPEMTESTELGLELRFLDNRLKMDVAYYTNNSYNQILSPRGPQSTGYIFTSINAGNVYNKGMELAISATPVQNKVWSWETSINIAGNRGTMDGLLPGMDIMYVTDVQYGNAKAASFSGGDFMAISGSQYLRTTDGEIILDKNGMPTYDKSTAHQVGNREPKLTGGWNNTISYKNFTFNMLWEFRVGGDVFNGTKYAMTQTGTSKFSGDVRDHLVIDGVENVGTADAPVYEVRHYEWFADQAYDFNGVRMSGANIIKGYYTGYYNYETANYITKVNSLRLRTVSVSYDIPRTFLDKLKVIKRASLSASANNLLLFTNYEGDPEVAAAGSGRGGSSSVGFDYCGVPATQSVSFGMNITF